MSTEGGSLRRVTRINSTVQYASHVANLVIPNFGDSVVAGGEFDFNEAAAAKAFFEHFKDVYDGIAFIPQAASLMENAAFHRNVRNQVRGIGLTVFNDSATYGSNGTLKGVEVYTDAFFASPRTSFHEIAHQWGDYLDWDTMGGITLAGHVPEAHTPLFYTPSTRVVGLNAAAAGTTSKGENFIGAVLEATRRVRKVGGGFEIERSGPPAVFHPLQLYRMGKLKKARVPDVTLFVSQGQFDPDSSSAPDVGTPVTGGTTVVTINDIMRQHGTRSGPSSNQWRRATVVVSRDGLLTQEEIDFWNFFAQRLMATQGVTTSAGLPSFFEATGKKVRLKTDINPRRSPKIKQKLTVTYPKFGTTDWRGIEFDKLVPSRFRAGKTVTLSGRVTATDLKNAIEIVLWFQVDGVPSSEWKLIREPVTGGRFSARVNFTGGEKDVYTLAVFLFKPGGSSAITIGALTPIIVN